MDTQTRKASMAQGRRKSLLRTRGPDAGRQKRHESRSIAGVGKRHGKMVEIRPSIAKKMGVVTKGKVTGAEEH